MSESIINFSKNEPRLAVDLPPQIRTIKDNLLRSLGADPEDFRMMAKAVMTMSDYYVMNPEKSSPWHESWAQIAYLAYYMPLNWWRLSGVISRAQQLNFFEGFDHYLDFGSGLGSLSMAFDAAGLTFKSGLCLERSREAIELHRKLAVASLTSLDWRQGAQPSKIEPRTLAVFSYSLTELRDLPDWVSECDGLMIVEPATRDDARRLQKIRSSLISLGWRVWGPCTHEAPCPLLEFSERDWCHDRFQWGRPSWLKGIEDHMPIKNGSLPCSWMLFRKTPSTASISRYARMTGDLQEFKGFAKQLVCRGPQREFIAWQRKHFKQGYPILARGALVTVRDDLPTKAQELRAQESGDVVPV